ncbi:hypothetical protein, partial [Corynebacterium variabile]|uniref:hypothetical protein n=1 Tax=Corynebacterium variabile TaxID=1727 RepID=UPI003F9203DD
MRNTTAGTFLEVAKDRTGASSPAAAIHAKVMSVSVMVTSVNDRTPASVRCGGPGVVWWLAVVCRGSRRLVVDRSLDAHTGEGADLH